MQLPQYLQQKINSLYSGLTKKELEQTRSELTRKYKEETGRSVSLIDSKKDSVLYAISRMPSTYAVIYTLLNQLVSQDLISDVSTVFDVGAGTGAGFFALKEIDSNIDLSLLERDENMLFVLNNLIDEKPEIIKGDINHLNLNKKFDLVMSSYVLSEMTEGDRKIALQKMFELSNKYVLLIDTGTPKTYAEYMKIKETAKELGCFVVAPCLHEKCSLKNDYCQFFARVERSSLQKMAKSATLGYEDEKYFYLLFSKNDNLPQKARVIRRPNIETNSIKLSLCTKEGVVQNNYTKKDKEMFKRAKKSKINDVID